ncbi:MAG: PilZ domain-containing protein [Deltaproteobacteria bacterium]|nr:PilZ domain-containing protein [Deltaproteobacteria bacterium]MBW2052537.1 PilZ domain-containing protein [Deltaproteobacteria bacterium]MBW2140783.1 PilZ domain-containing protein [Deltaproteobacteria bacterium]MBW2323581.1 PilZ domain-containing protein [Deltaproteobacteria bacterium]
MPEKDTRKEIRMPMSSVLGYNILEDASDYIRQVSPVSSWFKKPESGQELNENDPLEAFLIKMDKKLNYLIEMLSEKVGLRDYKYQARTIDISATGLCFITSDKLPQGAALEIGLILPSQPHRSMDIAAKVLWQKPYTGKGMKKARNKIGLIFVDILPEDQDSIVHYIFQKQREEIRSLKNES